MDSITHIAHGACIGEAALSKQTGKKALIIGAIAQSLPHVDVIASLWLSPADNLLVHRGLTHSFLLGIIAAIMLSFLVQKLFQLQDLSLMKLFFFFCLQISLHDLLDTAMLYVIGYRSVFDRNSFLTPFTYYPKNERLLRAGDKTVNVKQLLVFADDYYTVEYASGILVFNVLRFGQVLGWQDSIAHFTFQYFLNPSYDNTLVAQRGRFRGWNRKTIFKMYQRIKGR